jgi:predicted TIM-barrel fold metal-dependent hydrolase
MSAALRDCGGNLSDLAHCASHSGDAGCCEIDSDYPRFSVSRRGFLSGGVALGAMVASPLFAQQAAPSARAAQDAKPRRIDVHYHIAPPGWSSALTARKLLQPVWGGWSINKAVEDMDRDGVDLSITSITIPGVWFGEDASARRLARECNDFAAKLRSDHPGRFGMFGVPPLPDIDGSLAEIAYVMDTLKADGIGLLTNYGDKWLGDPALEPVFAELNRRKALIYTHPTVASCCRNLVPGLPPSVIEYGTDTSRAIAGIVFGGTAKRYPDMRIIFSHAGGTLPFLVERLVVRARAPETSQQLPVGGPLTALRSFYYDTAQASMAPPMAALRHVAPLSHILFGTDYPFRTAAEHITELKESQIFTASELQAIARDNVLALLPPHAG